jgi:RNA polymerase sigma factor (sigma-70 family)
MIFAEGPQLADRDEDLVARARAGDRVAFAALFERHRALAVALVGRLLDSRQDVEDVLQEAAVEALVCLDRLREPARFGPWLCGIALNLARRQVRHRGRPLPASWLPGQALTEEVLEETERAAKVREVVDTLPPGQRAAVRLFYLDGLNESEVAAELGIARTAVKSRLHKARRSLSGHLHEERRATVARPSLVEVDVVDVRREGAAAPGGGRAHAVVLRERDGDRVLPIFIAEPEGRAIASTLTGLQTPRPMTYQMVVNVVAALSGSVREVRIVRLTESTYVAELVLDGPSGLHTVDARPSDAINVALLIGAPIRVATELFDQWAAEYEQISADEYPEGAQDIRAGLGAFFSPPASEQLAPDAAAVLALARQEAIARSNPATGTGHLLLALLRRSTPERLAALGMPMNAVEGALDREPTSTMPIPDPPLSARLKWALFRAKRRANHRGEPRPTADDLFTALIDEQGGLSARLLDDASVDREAARAVFGGA